MEDESEEELPIMSQQPVLVPQSFCNRAGQSWCRVSWPDGVYWWMMGTSHVQRTPPDGSTASPGWHTNTGRRGATDPGADRGCDQAARVLAVPVRERGGASVPVHRQSVGHSSCYAEVVAPSANCAAHRRDSTGACFGGLVVDVLVDCSDKFQQFTVGYFSCATLVFDSGYIFCVSLDVFPAFST